MSSRFNETPSKKNTVERDVEGCGQTPNSDSHTHLHTRWGGWEKSSFGQDKIPTLLKESQDDRRQRRNEHLRPHPETQTQVLPENENTDGNQGVSEQSPN